MRTGTRERRSAVASVWAAGMVMMVAVGCASGAVRTRGGEVVGPGPAVAAVTGRDIDSVQVGYGNQARRRMTGSVSSVSGDVVRSQHVTRVEELLLRVPGVVVTPRGDGTYSISVRGSTTLGGFSQTEPLFVIDGLPVVDGLAVLRGMSPTDVERIDVLKDAEASIYGSRSANGVILVRTRHAKPSTE